MPAESKGSHHRTPAAAPQQPPSRLALPSRRPLPLPRPAGENSIVIVGGANQDPRSWELTGGARSLLASAGAVLLQREIPEAVNVAVAQVGGQSERAGGGRRRRPGPAPLPLGLFSGPVLGGRGGACRERERETEREGGERGRGREREIGAGGPASASSLWLLASLSLAQEPPAGSTHLARPAGSQGGGSARVPVRRRRGRAAFG
jgi:hypothetical protein